MQQFYAAICALALVCLVPSLRPAHAQTPAVATKSAGPFNYDIADEVTLDGTASTILAIPSPGMIPGAHLLIATLSGPVDVSLAAPSFATPKSVILGRSTPYFSCEVSNMLAGLMSR